MTDALATILTSKIKTIMDIWERRALNEIKAASHQESLALRNSLPEYLTQLSDALSQSIDRTAARVRADKIDSTRIGKKHGGERATAQHYTMDQMIAEYHILRQVIYDVLEEKRPLTPVEREVIVCSIEQAVNDAATQFSDSLNDLREKLSQTLAHDLRNPLTTAKLCTDLIIRNVSDTTMIIEKSKRALKSLNRIDKMIEDLLDASRISAGEHQPLDFNELDLDWLVREISYELNIAFEDRLIVETHGSCMGLWNEDGLRRMIENLVTNAFKYGYPRTPVLLSVKHDEESATITVHNEGDPISSEQLPILFEKFKRARQSEDKVGWGLGLTVVKSMVSAHMGAIKVESEQGKGTTFIIKLPLDPTKAKQPII